MFKQLRSRTIALYGGLSIVTIWTLIRSFTNGVNFDIVGQIGLADQWAHGEIAGSQLGATSYLLKMPVYFLANQFTAIPPLYRITLLALAFNLLTFFLLFRIYEKVMGLYGTQNRQWFYIAFVWLAVIAGNLYWLDYANSRNLETAGGLLFIYLVLSYLKQAQAQKILLLGLTGLLVFFADPLQFFVCGTGSCLFVMGRALLKQTKRDNLAAALITATTLLAYGGARLLLSGVQSLLHVSNLTPQTIPLELTIEYLVSVGYGLAMSTLTIFDANLLKGSSGPLLLRQIVNAGLLAIMLTAVIRLLRSKRQNVTIGIGLTLIALNYGLYVASGQVTQWQTARYLIMVPLLMVLMIAVRGDSPLKKKIQLRAQLLAIGLLIVSSVLLLGAFALSIPKRYSQDQHIAATVNYLKKEKFKYALASREIGITTTYFSQGTTHVLPMGCDAKHMLQPTNLFYDQAAFAGLYRYHKEVPILVGDRGIEFGQNNCSQNDIVAQFGAPKRLEKIPGVGLSLIYDAASLRMTGIDAIVGHERKLTHSEAVQLGLLPSETLRPLPVLPKLSGCTKGVIDVVVAHPDDDLLFMNPNLSNKFATHCVRTIFVTAGDDGLDAKYWQGRQRGIEAAYAAMLSVESDWTDNLTSISGQPILMRQLIGRPSVILVFLRLPDGNVQGQGFNSTNHVSLEKLSHSDQAVLTVDSSASYTYQQLTNILSDIFRFDKPVSIYTHLADGDLSRGDHSDHRAVSAMTQLARSAAKSNSSMSQFIGYPVGELIPNLSDDDVAQKSAIFSIYALEDGMICRRENRCSINQTYSRYFSRTYEIETPATVKPKLAPKKSRARPQTHQQPTPLELFQRRAN